MKEIDLRSLHSNTIDEIKINEEYYIDEDYYKNTDIKKLLPVKVEGYINRITDTDDYIYLEVNGKMILEDSISLLDVEYPFSFKIDGNLTEILGNCPNTLDILELLWENIVLEVPLKFTKEEDFSKFKGEGWRLVSEDEEKLKNNPFKEILDEFGKE